VYSKLVYVLVTLATVLHWASDQSDSRAILLQSRKFAAGLEWVIKMGGIFARRQA